MAKAKHIQLRWNGYAWHETDDSDPGCIPFIMLLRQKPQWATIFKGLLVDRQFQRRLTYDRAS